MIVIINHEREESEKYCDLLNSKGIESKISNSEPVICSSDKILITDCNDIDKLIRKFQLLNLFSLLKMIKKPIIGIGLGAAIMHEKIQTIDKTGLGYFPGAVKVISHLDPKENVRLNMISNKNTLADLDNIKFKISKLITVTTDNDLVADYEFKGANYPAVIKRGKNAGVLLDVAGSGENGVQLLRGIISN